MKMIIYWCGIFLSVFLIASLKHIGIFIYVYIMYGDIYFANDALKDIFSFTIPLFLGLMVKKWIYYKFSIK